MKSSLARSLLRAAALSLSTTLGTGIVATACSEEFGSCISPPSDTGPLACVTEFDCPTYTCSCQDESMGGGFARCLDGACETNGEAGCVVFCIDSPVVSVGAQPEPNVVGSAECTAFCEWFTTNTAASQGCADTPCTPYAVCSVHEGECEEDARKRLDCMVRTATFECDTGGVVNVESDCL